ncbi:MAG: Signal peptidase-like protein, partial [Chitinophagia bacterium]|nr:Signal peptidase-like protein [Chitinophagia bacterium]
LQMKKYGAPENSITRRILHPSTDDELEFWRNQKAREPEILIKSRVIAKTLNLDMKLCEVEVQADGKKGTFFYTADQRVDFRELIKLYAADFKMKIEMRQIGARQESAKVGGIGSCGRELCCSTWLSDFKSVNTTAARYQNLSINQAKLSGQCGRLKCCLNYELDTYLDALSVFPDHADHLDTVKGMAHLQKRDIFKNLMWYSYSDNNKQYPLSITRVKEIVRMNRQGQKAEELQPVELEAKTDRQGNVVKTEVGFVNDVGQISLKNLEKNNKKKKPGNKNQGRDRQQGEGRERQQGEGNRPPQQQRQQKQGVGQPEGNQQPRQPRPEGSNGGQRPQGDRRPQGEPRTQGERRPQGEPRPPREPRPQGEQGEQRPRNEQRPQGEPRPQAEGGAERPPRPPRPQQGTRPQNQQDGGGDAPAEGGQPNRNRNNRNNRRGNDRRPDRRDNQGGEGAPSAPQPPA